MSVGPIASYASTLKAIALSVAVMLVAAGLFMGGRAVGVGQSAGDINKLVAKIAAKDVALGNAAASLRGAAGALRAVNEEAERRIREAALAEQRANDAAMVAANAKAEADRRMVDIDKRIDQARRNPTCDALLRADLHQVCGL